jgi:hypothetical protein
VATKTQDARKKREEARKQRRETAGNRETESQQESSGGGGGRPEEGGGVGTGALVGIGAAVGGLAGVATAVRRRRRKRRNDDGGSQVEASEPSGYDEPDEDRDYEDDGDDDGGAVATAKEKASQAKEKAHPSQLRELAATMLEAALDAVKQHGEPQEADEDEDSDAEMTRARRDTHDRDEVEDEEDDEEDHEPRGVAGQPEETAAGAEAPRGDQDDDDAAPSRNGDGGGALDMRLVRRAKEQLAALVGREPEAVTSVEHDGDGWRIALEVVELERVPNSTDVLATYEVRLDDDGDLEEYARVRRYSRSQADGEGM